LLESSIPPESKPTDAIGSALVPILIPVDIPAVAEPMVKPVRVTSTTVLASIPRFATVITTDLPSGIDGMPNEVGPLGVTKPAATTAVKKYKGNVNVMVLPISSLPPAEVMKDNVAVEFFLPANRSEIAIANEAFATWPPITPESLPFDAIGSELDVMKIPVEFPAVEAPMVKPERVTVTRELDGIAWFEVKTTIWLAVCSMQVPVRPLGSVKPSAGNELPISKKFDG
jgi:hypothetical protein